VAGARLPAAGGFGPARHPRIEQHARPGGGTNYSLPIQTMLLLTSLSFIPAALLMMTCFTRIVIVLSLLRQALGTQSTPPTRCWSACRCS
jgi:flagellar biosynthetic protein FliP